MDPGSRSALGLGGDPFLSPLDDDVGWWSLGRQLAPAWMGIDLAASVPITRGLTNGRGNLSAHEPAWTLAAGDEFMGRPWLIWSQLSSPRWDRSWHSGVGGFDYHGSSTRLQVGARLVDVVPGLTTQVTAPVWESTGDARGPRFGAGLRYDLARRLRVQTSWGRSHQPEFVHFDLKGEPWDVSMNLVSDEWRSDARLLLPRGFGVEGHFARADLSAKRSRDTNPSYHLDPSGRFQSGDATLHWKSSARLRFLYRWSRKSLDSRGRFSWGGQMFGNLTYARATLESHLVGVQRSLGSRSRLLFDMERSNLHGKARGQIELWPFTETLIDLLGPRYTGKAVMEARWTRVHMGLERRWHRRVRARFGVAWYRATPEAYLDTWRPAVLVFGRADEERTSLSVTELQLAAFSMGWRFSFGRFDLDLAVRQFAPLDVEKAARSTPEPTGGPRTPAEAATSSPGATGWKWPGGTFLELGLVQGF